MTSLPEGEVKKAEAKLESKIKESQALKEEMIKYIKLSYPNANKELYLRIKEQVKDAKASGENSGKSYKEAKQRFYILVIYSRRDSYAKTNFNLYICILTGI